MNREIIIHDFFYCRKFDISRVAPLFTRKYLYSMLPAGISPFLTVQGLMLYILATDFRLRSSSRSFSATSGLNVNEHFAIRPQFSIGCLTFGAHYKYYC
jgi:hypothetical protein